MVLLAAKVTAAGSSQLALRAPFPVFNNVFIADVYLLFSITSLSYPVLLFYFLNSDSLSKDKSTELALQVTRVQDEISLHFLFSPTQPRGTAALRSGEVVAGEPVASRG